MSCSFHATFPLRKDVRPFVVGGLQCLSAIRAFEVIGRLACRLALGAAVTYSRSGPAVTKHLSRFTSDRMSLTQSGDRQAPWQNSGARVSTRMAAELRRSAAGAKTKPVEQGPQRVVLTGEMLRRCQTPTPHTSMPGGQVVSLLSTIQRANATLFEVAKGCLGITTPQQCLTSVKRG